MLVHTLSTARAPRGDLEDALIARGHDVRDHHLTDRPDPRAVVDVVRAATVTPVTGVLHALDADAWQAGAAARCATGHRLVARFDLADRPAMTPARATADAAGRARELRACLHAADAVITTSEPARDWLVGAGVADPDRVRVTADVVTPLPAPLVPPPNRRRLLCLDPLTGPGDVPSLLRMLLLVPGAHLTLAGSVPVDDLVRWMRLGGRVACATIRTRADVQDLVDAADVVLSGPGGLGAAPHAALLAMWRGRPFVGVATPALDEVVVDGTTGVLTGAGRRQPHAVLRDLLGSPFAVLAQGWSGRQRAEARFGTGRDVAAVEDVYQLACA